MCFVFVVRVVDVVFVSVLWFVFGVVVVVVVVVGWLGGVGVLDGEVELGGDAGVVMLDMFGYSVEHNSSPLDIYY